MRGDAGGDAEPCSNQAFRHRGRSLGCEVCEPGAGQTGEQDVAVQAAADDSDQERVQDGSRLVHESGCRGDGVDEVRNVFDDCETEPDHRAEHEAVHDAVEFARGNEEDRDDAHQLERLLDARADDRGTPLSRQVRGGELAQNRKPGLVGVGGEARRDHATPDQGRRQKKLGLSLE